MGGVPIAPAKIHFDLLEPQVSARDVQSIGLESWAARAETSSSLNLSVSYNLVKNETLPPAQFFAFVAREWQARPCGITHGMWRHVFNVPEQSAR